MAILVSAMCRSMRPFVVVPPFPLTPDKLLRVAAVFKAGGYLSFDNYAYRAKSEHLERGFEDPCPWGPALAKAFADAVRSCARGAGASRVRGELVELDVGWDGVSGKGRHDRAILEFGCYSRSFWRCNFVVVFVVP